MLMLIPALSWSQSTSETALLFSRTMPGGSARIQGLGGAQTSLGGDYSSAFSNPAGLGMFNRSEFSITPGFFSNMTQADYLGNSSDATKTNLAAPGISFVFQSEKDGRKGFLSGTFAITFNRVNNFNNTFQYAGRNDKNSIIDYFLQDASGLDPSEFRQNGDYFNTPTGLAYNNYLVEDSTFINPNASRLDYLSVLGTFNDPNDIRSQLQEEEVKTEGAQNQWSFSYGVNLSDKFFIGGGVGFTSLRYQSLKSYRESDFFFDLDPSFNPLDRLVLNEELKINGSGINATVGAIIRPIEMLQVGISYMTPTSYGLTDTYSANMNTDWNDFDYFGDGSEFLNAEREQTDIVTSEYSLKTPGKLNVGATFFVKKYGFITADVQVVDYSGAKYNSSIDGISYDQDNASIRSLYQSTINYRLGAEARLNNYRARLGYAHMPDPFSTEQNGVNRSITNYTTGLGYRTAKFYCDLALVFTNGNSTYRPYRVNSEFSPLVTAANKNTSVLVTLGFPF